MTIQSWDPTSPGANSPAGQGDDEIRAIKEDVQTVFPALTDEIQKGFGNPAPTSAEFTQLFTDVDNLKESQGLFPLGSIIMWSGNDGSIPSGWTICNGTNVNNVEVPDLTTRFIVGANALTPVGASGGSYETGPAGEFSSTVTVNPHVITEENLPPHDHTLFVPGAPVTSDIAVAAGQASAVSGDGAAGQANSPYTINPSAIPDTNEPTVGRSGVGSGTSAPLTHDAATITGDGHTHTFNPKYYALSFIMFVGAEILP